MRSTAFRLVLATAVVAMAATGCAKKKPTITDTSTTAQDVGGFGPGSGAGTAPGGYGAGGGGLGVDGQPLPPGVFLDANGNYVDANGNPVDANGNPIGGAVSGGGLYGQTDGGPAYVDAGSDPYGANTAQGGLYDNTVPGGSAYGAQQAGAGNYNFAGDDGSPNYFSQRVGDRVLFETDSSQLDSEAQETLRRQASWLQRHRQLAVTIEGHADERGTRDYNLALGARRANASRSYLIGLGVDPNRLRTVSYGKERPVDPRSTPTGWRVNRRAVTTLRSIGAGS